MNFQKTTEDTFLLSGHSAKLTNSQSENYHIIRKQWQLFNKDLRFHRVNLGRNWRKFGVTIRQNDGYRYFTGIPDPVNGFEKLKIVGGSFLKFQHEGRMDLIKVTIHVIYKQVLPGLKINRQREIMHFEVYDHRFKWNDQTSLIDILIPTEEF